MGKKAVPDWLNSSLWSSKPSDDRPPPYAPVTLKPESPQREPSPPPPIPPTVTSPPSPELVEPLPSDPGPPDFSPEEISRQALILSELSKKVINIGELRRLVCQGIPDAARVRPAIWKILLHYLPNDRLFWQHELESKRSQYRSFKEELLQNPSEITRKMDEHAKHEELNSESRALLHRSEISQGEHPLSLGSSSVWNQFFQEAEIIEQIDRDVMRTHPDMQFFSGDSYFSKANQESLRHILILFAKLNPGIRYVQGMNEVLAPLFYVFRNDPEENNSAHAEADTFFCFVELLSGFRDNFCKQLDNSVVGIRSTITKLSQLLKKHDGELWRHLEVTTRKHNSAMSLSMLTAKSLIFILFAVAGAVAESPFTSDEESQIQRFQQYLRIPTAHPNPDYAAAVSFLSSQAHSIGLQTLTLDLTPGKPLLLLSWPGSAPSLPSILLNSHLDSVPAEPSHWIHPPFSAHRDANGNIYARGAQDDKCIAIQYLEALRNLKARGFSPLRSIHVSFVPDEEIGGADGHAKFVASDQFRRLNIGFVLDEGQASPTDELRVFYADRIPFSLIVKAVGSPGHGSKMYDGSAAENLMECEGVVRRFRDGQFDLVKAGIKEGYEVISVNPVYMKAGTPTPTGFVMNLQPSEAEMGFDVRLPPTEDVDVLRKRIQEEWAPISRNMTFQLIQKGPTRDINGRPLLTETNESNPWWSVFKQAISAAGGKLGKPEILSSTTDARFMRQMGIPTLGFSPMTNTPILLHDHNEFLKDTVFLNGIKVYEHLISALSSFQSESILEQIDLER